MPHPIHREFAIALRNHGDRRARYSNGHFRMLLAISLELINKADSDQAREQGLGYDSHY